MLDLFKERIKVLDLIKENKRLKEELAQKDIIIQYLNGCVNKANRRYLEQVRQVNQIKSIDHLSFPNSEVDNQISINDILEN